jgi:allantoicase
MDPPLLLVTMSILEKQKNILAPGKAKNMGDGWETRRRRGKGFDWLILNSLDGKRNR